MKVSFRLGTILTSFAYSAVGLRGTQSRMKHRNECLEFVPRYPDDNLTNNALYYLVCGFLRVLALIEKVLQTVGIR